MRTEVTRMFRMGDVELVRITMAHGRSEAKSRSLK